MNVTFERGEETHGLNAPIERGLFSIIEIQNLSRPKIYVFIYVQPGSKICAKNVKAGRGDLNKQILYRNMSSIMPR